MQWSLQKPTLQSVAENLGGGGGGGGQGKIEELQQECVCGGGKRNFLKKVRPTTYLGLSPKAIIFITHEYIEK